MFPVLILEHVFFFNMLNPQEKIHFQSYHVIVSLEKKTEYE